MFLKAIPVSVLSGSYCFPTQLMAGTLLLIFLLIVDFKQYEILKQMIHTTILLTICTTTMNLFRNAQAKPLNQKKRLKFNIFSWLAWYAAASKFAAWKLSSFRAQQTFYRTILCYSFDPAHPFIRSWIFSTGSSIPFYTLT